MSALAFVIDRVRPCVVQIRAGDLDAEQVIGTGFIIHRGGYVITAKHVTEAAHHLSVGGQSRITVGLAIPNMDVPVKMRGNFEIVECDLVEEDPRHDLALLKMKNNPFQSGRQPGVSTIAGGGMTVNGLWGLAPLNVGRPRDGDAIVVSGYPMAHPTLITTAGIVASAWYVESMDVTPQGALPGFSVTDMRDAYLADVAVNPGNSGGPVYLQDDGTVIGVCVAFQIAKAEAGGIPLRYNSGLSIVVPIRYSVELLGRHEDIRPPSS